MEIRPVTAKQLPECADVIRKSFATVAQDFGFTRENCPGHPAFITNKQLESKINDGCRSFGCFVGEKIIGFVSLNDKGGGVYAMNSVSILPECRHFKYGKALLDFCKAKVEEFGGIRIEIEIIEENTALKDWYIANGFIHTETKRFEYLPFIVGYMKWDLPI
ncbi:MAG: GNAT family N-acetyltransferase [Oscillospiraceae bacterium]|nr:GNAT family N-acetyltransferase [Oscillospiraceae bacterium]